LILNITPLQNIYIDRNVASALFTPSQMMTPSWIGLIHVYKQIVTLHHRCYVTLRHLFIEKAGNKGENVENKVRGEGEKGKGEA